MHEVAVKDIKIGKNRPLALIAGPCVLEELAVVREIAQELKRISKADTKSQRKFQNTNYTNIRMAPMKYSCN